ncbi:MAG: RHS repeat domain-containing protein [Methylobacter sp.]
MANYSPSNNGKACPEISNPINPAVGNKFQIEEDITGTKTTLPLSFIRTYNSGVSVKTALGIGWRHNYERSINWLPSGAVEVMGPDGKIYTFTRFGANYTAPDTNDVLVAINYGTSWKYITTDNQVEIYDSNGNMTSITDRSGLTQTLTYNAVTRLLSKVTDSYV